MRRKLLYFGILLLAIGACKTEDKLTYEQGTFAPNWKSLADNYQVPDWYKKGRFGIWVHASPQDAGEIGDWYARNLYTQGHWQNKHHVKKFGHPSEFGYKDVCNEWKLEEWNPDEMMKLYKHAGAKFFVGMGNHHCNFDMWDSKYQEWNSKNVGPKRDVLGEWKKAADKYGLRFGTSLHAINSWGWFDSGRAADTSGVKKGVPYDIAAATKADGKGKWWEGLDPQELYGPPHKPGTNGDAPTKAFMMKFYKRFQEVVDKYDIDYLYWDCHYTGVWRQFVRFADTIPSNAENSLRQTPFKNMGITAIAHFYNMNMKKHGGKLEAVTTIKSVPEEFRGCLVHDYEHGTPDHILPNIWERGFGLGGWHYSHGQFKKTRTMQALSMLVDVVSKNGVFLMNVPMSPRGKHDPLAVETLKEVGDWMAINGEAIYESNPWKKFGNGKIRYTRNGNTVYVCVPDKELDKKLNLEDFGAETVTVKSCILLGVDEKVDWNQGKNELTINVPEKRASKYIQVFKLKI
ncbi:alpha-L-fucosidase [Prolixibacteraceae bacterium JC049]|nr:alpha-L-fucosidase [Prolixibacteraceae bacterium JC049]